MAMIAGQLHANAVRVTGTDLPRVALAAGLALEAGLTVWFSPHPGDLTGDGIVSYLAEAARVAEELRSPAGSVVMVTAIGYCAEIGPRGYDEHQALEGAAGSAGRTESTSVSR